MIKDKLNNPNNFSIYNIKHGWLVLQIEELIFQVSYLSDDMYEELEKIKDMKDGNVLKIILDGEGPELTLIIFLEYPYLHIICISYGQKELCEFYFFMFDYRMFKKKIEQVLLDIRNDYETYFRINENDFE